MQLKPATFPSLGVDCITALDSVRCAALKAAGIGFAVRYLGSLGALETNAILNSGLGLMTVGYSRAPGWVPTAGMGAADGMQDVQHYHNAGLMVGSTVWIDLEGCAGTVDQATGWIEERATVLHSAGMDVGLYVGAYQPLGATQLYALPSIDRYWRSLSSGVPEPACGWSMVQLYKTVVIGGTEVDVDVVQYDHKYRLPMMVTQ